MVDFLLHYSNIDPAARNNMALGYALIYEQFTIARLLLKDPRIDPSIDDNIAIKAMTTQNKQTFF